MQNREYYPVEEKGNVQIMDNKIILDWVRYAGGDPSDYMYCILCGKHIEDGRSRTVEVSVAGEIMGFKDKKGTWITLPYETSESQGEWEVGSECFKKIEKLYKEISKEDK